MKSTIVVTGRIGSGKGTVAQLLQEKGYKSFVTSSEVEKDVRARRLPQTRPYYQQTARLTRLELGNDIYGRYLADRITNLRNVGILGNVVIDGARHPDMLSYVQNALGAFVVWVEADDEIRYQRIKQRKRNLDCGISREEFNLLDARDRGFNQPDYADQTDACRRLADVIIENNGTVDELKKRLNEQLLHFGIEGVINHTERR